MMAGSMGRWSGTVGPGDTWSGTNRASVGAGRRDGWLSILDAASHGPADRPHMDWVESDY